MITAEQIEQSPRWQELRERTATQAGIYRKVGSYQYAVLPPRSVVDGLAFTVMESRAEAFARSSDIEEESS